MNDSPAKAAGVSRRSVLLLAGLLLLALLCWQGWTWWRAQAGAVQAQNREASQRLTALEQRVGSQRRDQRAHAQRLQDVAATNRVLRDEVLGLSQRGALLEESVARLASSTRHGPQALRLDGIELLLGQAEQRMAVAADIEGARRAYALAEAALHEVDDLHLLNLRQALAQERAALTALGQGPRAAMAARLDRFAAALEALPEVTPTTAPRPAWQRALAPLVDVQPTRTAAALGPGERDSGEAALQVELALARAALERGDTASLRSALERVDRWLPRLWPPSPPLTRARAELRTMREAGVDIDFPELGSTLEQLRALRAAVPPLRLLPAAPAAAAATGTPP